MSNEETLKGVLKKINTLKKETADFRDKLREQVEDIQEILHSVEDGYEHLDDAVSELERAIDSVSQYV